MKKLINMDLTSGNISKTIWKLALPMMIGNLFQTLFNVVDMIYVGKLGSSSIAAVAMSGTIMHLIIVAIIGVGTGTTALISRFIGAKKGDEANRVFMQSFIIAFVGWIILALFGYFIAPGALQILGAEEEVFRLGGAYLQIFFIGSLGFFMMGVLRSAMQGSGDAITPMILLACSTIINLILDPLLIFGIWIFPRMGVKGAALATIISQSIMMIIGWIYVALGHHYHLTFDWKNLRIEWDYIKRILLIGFPSSLQMLLRSMATILIMGFVAPYGTLAVAAYGIGMRINMIVMMPGFGLAMAAATLVGQNLGAGKPDRAEKSGWLAVGYYIIIMLIMGIIFYIFAPQLISIFNKEEGVINIGVEYLRIITPFYIFLAMAIVLNRAITGAGDTVAALSITAICLLGIQFGLIMYLPKLANLGTKALWMAIVIAMTSQGLMAAGWFKLGRWKHRKI